MIYFIIFIVLAALISNFGRRKMKLAGSFVMFAGIITLTSVPLISLILLVFGAILLSK